MATGSIKVMVLANDTLVVTWPSGVTHNVHSSGETAVSPHAVDSEATARIDQYYPHAEFAVEV